MKDSKNTKTMEVLRQYECIRPLYSQLTTKVTRLIEEILYANNIKYHIIEKRTKDVESLREKLVRKSEQYIDPLNEITDFSGIRIITYFLDDVYEISKLILNEFDIDKENSIDQGILLNENEFGYRSVHYIASISNTRMNLPEWRDFSNLMFELQIRTVLQHAWAGISHTLQYKHESEVPSQLRRQLFRLAGLFELADEEFVDIKVQNNNIANSTNEVIENPDDVEINLLTIGRFLTESDLVNDIHLRAEEVGYLFEDFYYPEEDDDKFNTMIVLYCEIAGIKSIGQLISALNNFPVTRYLLEQREANEGEWLVSDSFLICLILIGIYHKKFPLNILIRLGWHKSNAERALKIARNFLIDSEEEGDIA